MSKQPDQLSQLLLEADGLLLLLYRHRDETPIDAINLLRRKLQLILALTDGLEDEESPTDIEHDRIESTIENSSESLKTDEVKTDGEKDAEVEKTVSVIPNYESTIGDSIHIDSPSDDNYVKDTEAPQSESDANVHISQKDISTEYDQSESQANSYSSDNLDIDWYIESTLEHSSINDTNNLQQKTNEPVMYEPIENPVILENDVTFMDDTAPKVEHTYIDDAPIYKPHLNRIDENMSAQSTNRNENNVPRRPVSSVFNLNDKFRFRRELFGNSDAQYVECLDLLSAMTSIEEAKEYLYEDLSWDPQNEDVKAFVDLLQNYYKY